MRHLIAVLLLACACSGTSMRENCTNGKDDDGNGKVDCDDPDCHGTTFCDVDAGYWGECARCGQSCTKQSDCVGTNVLDERPIPQCGMSHCQLFNQKVQLRIEYNTASWGGVSASLLGAITTRWVSKTAVDGSAVTCAQLIAAAPSVTSASQLEATGRFQLLGFDATKVAQTGASVANPTSIPYVYTGTGRDYVIYTEAWAGGIDSTTHLPNGMRKGKGCVETGPEVAPITTADDCASDAGTCRTLRLTLPAPCPMPDAGC